MFLKIKISPGFSGWKGNASFKILLWRTLVPGTSWWSKSTLLSAAQEEFSPLIFLLYVPTLLFRGKAWLNLNLQEWALSWAFLMVLQQPSALPAVTRGLFPVLNMFLAGTVTKVMENVLPSLPGESGTPSWITELWLNYTGRGERGGRQSLFSGKGWSWPECEFAVGWQ